MHPLPDGAKTALSSLGPPRGCHLFVMLSGIDARSGAEGACSDRQVPPTTHLVLNPHPTFATWIQTGLTTASSWIALLQSTCEGLRREARRASVSRRCYKHPYHGGVAWNRAWSLQAPFSSTFSRLLVVVNAGACSSLLVFSLDIFISPLGL